MNLKDLDLMSFAGAVGHQAAARLFAVLEGDESGLSNDWLYGGAANIEVFEAFFDQHGEVEQQAHLDFMANFICSRQEKNGEAIYGLAKQEAIYPKIINPEDSALFKDEPYSLRIAYITFSRVTLATFLDLQSQLQIQLAAEAEENPAPAPSLAPEDSILEEVDGVGDEVPHADGLRALEVETAKAKAATAKKDARNAKRREDRANAKAAQDTKDAEKVDAQDAEKAGETAKPNTVGDAGDAGDGDTRDDSGGTQQAPLSAGEPLAKQSKPKGGRPRKTPAKNRPARKSRAKRK